MVMKLMHWIDVDKINWDYLSSNPNAIDILKENFEKISWCRLSLNPNAIEILKENLDKINWWCLSSNPNAIDLLKENPDKIDWDCLSENPSIFEPIVAPIYKEELIAAVFHPTRFARYLYEFGFDMNDL